MSNNNLTEFEKEALLNPKYFLQVVEDFADRIIFFHKWKMTFEQQYQNSKRSKYIDHLVGSSTIKEQELRQIESFRLQGLTQQQIADILGLSRQTVSKKLKILNTK